MDYASKDIRNILVAGHAGCGKTTLTEALLYTPRKPAARHR